MLLLCWKMKNYYRLTVWQNVLMFYWTKFIKKDFLYFDFKMTIFTQNQNTYEFHVEMKIVGIKINSSMSVFHIEIIFVLDSNLLDNFVILINSKLISNGTKILSYIRMFHFWTSNQKKTSHSHFRLGYNLKFACDRFCASHRIEINRWEMSTLLRKVRTTKGIRHCQIRMHEIRH